MSLLNYADSICVTSITSTCQMEVVLVVVSIVTCWSYVKLVEICWQVASWYYMKGHVSNYLSLAHVIYGDSFLMS